MEECIMEIRPIKTEQDYKEALETIEILLTCAAESEDAAKLEVLSILVQTYEENNYKIDYPTPANAIKFKIEQMGLTRKDLEECVGHRSKISEVLSGKRNLSLSMIKKLHKILHIPAEILIQS